MWVEKGRITDRNEVLKQNCYIVAGLNNMLPHEVKLANLEVLLAGERNDPMPIEHYDYA